MDVFNPYLERIEDPANRARTAEVLRWVGQTFEQLQPKIAWNQPMFTDHGTFIVGFSASKRHLAVAPERQALSRFVPDIREAGYDYSKELIRLRWDQPVDYALLERILRYNIEDKQDCATFWRKEGPV